MDSKNVLIQEYKKVFVVTICKSRLTNENDIMEFKTEVNKLIDRTEKIHMLIDFSQVMFLTSFVIGQLVAIYKQIKAAKGKMALCCVNPSIMEIFKITFLTKVFPIYKDQKEGISKLQSRYGIF